MLFVELRFLFFFVAVLAVYWSLRQSRTRKQFLIVASYVFYAAWDWRFLGLLLLSTVMDYSIGRLLATRVRTARWRRTLLVASISANLFILFVFKYFNFFVSSFTGWTLSLVLPVGISFYTFETISYVVDVYRGDAPARSLEDFALFLSFFPHLVAGPILRPREFLPQLDEEKRFASVDVRKNLMLILVGFWKKACVADNLAPFVDSFFTAPAASSPLGSWAAIFLWPIQVYCDFSGYCDIAVGCAGLLGYELVANFDYPYLASSLQAYWRRWHISLSRFLRDYLYIPLGGNRGSRWLAFRNLMLTTVLGGLWHGAGWQFLTWGAWHGLGLYAERSLPKPPRAAGVIVTFLFCCLGLALFRSPTTHIAHEILRALSGRVGIAVSRADRFALGVAVLLASVHIFFRRYPVANWWRAMPAWRFAALYGITCALMLPLASVKYRPFYYFQF
jgi:alginate O-acetyltransferase complex protein AlgI